MNKKILSATYTVIFLVVLTVKSQKPIAASYRPEDDLQVMLPSLQYVLENTYEVKG